MELTRICKKCGKEYPLSELKKDNTCKYGRQQFCKYCHAEYALKRSHIKGGVTPYTELPSCSSYFGVHIAERLLSKVFHTVEKMPLNNHGYDFVCGKGKKIDSKCSATKIERGHSNRWKFDIERNTGSDYFACIAFDNRTDLNPLYFWLIPSGKVNHLRCLTISISTLDKWDVYRQPIDKMLECCTTLKEKGGSA